MSAGQALKQTVDMFCEPREMIEENNHRNELFKLEEMVPLAE